VSRSRDREYQATVHAITIQQHRARTALPVIASFLGSGQTKMFAQCIEEGDSIIESRIIVSVVYAEK
jgi:hypothetical protein